MRREDGTYYEHIRCIDEIGVTVSMDTDGGEVCLWVREERGMVRLGLQEMHTLVDLLVRSMSVADPESPGTQVREYDETEPLEPGDVYASAIQTYRVDEDELDVVRANIDRTLGAERVEAAKTTEAGSILLKDLEIEVQSGNDLCMTISRLWSDCGAHRVKQGYILGRLDEALGPEAGGEEE